MVFNWKEIGNIVNSDKSLSSVTKSNISISNNGKRVIIGAPEHNDNDNIQTGAVLIYDWNGSNWNKNVIHGENEYDRAGYSVSLSGRGDRIVFGVPGYDSDVGRVCVYDYNSKTFEWDNKTTITLNGAESFEEFGTSVALTTDGKKLLIGSPGAKKGNNPLMQTGKVQLYNLETNKISNTIYGKNNFQRFGSHVSVSNRDPSSTGTLLMLVGAEGDNTHQLHSLTGYNSSRVLPSVSDQGHVVAISDGGTRIVIGDTSNNEGVGKVIYYTMDSGRYKESATVKGSSLNEQFGKAIYLSYDGAYVGISSNMESITLFREVYAYDSNNGPNLNKVEQKPDEPQPDEPMLKSKPKKRIVKFTVSNNKPKNIENAKDTKIDRIIKPKPKVIDVQTDKINNPAKKTATVSKEITSRKINVTSPTSKSSFKIKDRYTKSNPLKYHYPYRYKSQNQSSINCDCSRCRVNGVNRVNGLDLRESSVLAPDISYSRDHIQKSIPRSSRPFKPRTKRRIPNMDDLIGMTY